MIIHTGNRTDIPAFYAKWFANRLKEGYVCVRNPYNPIQVTRYSLRPEVVDVIAFCSKNPAPLFPYMDLLEPYAQYWHVTITPYGKEIEPHVPDKEKVMEDFIALSQMVGPENMVWRFDPIFITDTYTLDFHIEAFERMARKLQGSTHICVISFIDLYEKTKRNFPEVREVSAAERAQLGKAIVEIATRYGMVVRPCAEGTDLAMFGADCTGCMRQSDFEGAMGTRLNVPKADAKSHRAECSCLFGRDIGQYNTCGHLCKYCYANVDPDIVRENMARHDPNSPFLIGGEMPGDMVHIANQKSWRDDQLTLFDTF